MMSRFTRILVAGAAVLVTVGATTGCSTTPSTTSPASAATTSSNAASANTASSNAASLPANRQSVGVEEFAAAIHQPGVVLIDVRTPAEFAAGHLAGAKNIDVSDSGFSSAIASLAKDAHYAIYCHSGNRSRAAMQLMNDAGFSHVFDLAGGISAWEAAGQPTTT